ncbi:MAG: aminotransferase class V-fold PLP-dependent enzyme, partial [Methanoregulaceae archaeon]|nr:aminotransferase class V-fold PLP-dependent enzyme [Methanoregulaceae archaeon]
MAAGEFTTPLHSRQAEGSGVQNTSGGIGLGAAVDYLDRVGTDRIRHHEQSLTRRLVTGLRAIGKVRVFAPPDPGQMAGIVSFTVPGLSSPDIAGILDETSDIIVGSGDHSCAPLMKVIGADTGTVRASLHLYSTEEDVDLLVATVAEIASGV